MAEFDYRVAAYHESGHAVASYLLHVPIQSVYVTPGLSECVSGLTIGEIVSRNLIRQCATVAAVGAIVERIFFGDADSVACEIDNNVIEKGLLPRIEDDTKRRELKENLQQLAIEVTQRPRFRVAVKLLAEELLKQPGIRKEIQGPRATAIVRVALEA
jgi:hypothetical protein